MTKADRLKVIQSQARKAGKVSTPAKAKAARNNGRKGGRPKGLSARKADWCEMIALANKATEQRNALLLAAADLLQEAPGLTFSTPRFGMAIRVLEETVKLINEDRVLGDKVVAGKGKERDTGEVTPCPLADLEEDES